MPITRPSRPALFMLAPVCALLLAACGTAVSTSSFKGEQHAIAQEIADFQSHATSSEQGKICEGDLAAAVVRRLGGKSGCEAAIKLQLNEVDSLEVSLQSVQIGAGGTTATAHVKSTYKGKLKPGTLTLTKEGGKWKIAGL
ncbi:MAG TPA: hypothetical protein VHT27_01420 [Solirubrobacteraceae bacterium]|jgi:hypothetical protein|nr:hypothetical protein [Solirubrobacteraceae bacterium]